MSIISNASPDELSSEYYKQNESFCLNLKKQLLNLGFNEIHGKYNAWSYIVCTNRITYYCLTSLNCFLDVLEYTSTKYRPEAPLRLSS